MEEIIKERKNPTEDKVFNFIELKGGLKK